MRSELKKPQLTSWGILMGLALTLLLLGALSAVVAVGYMGAWGLARQVEHAAALEVLSRQQRQIAACLTRAGLMDSVIDLEQGREHGRETSKRRNVETSKPDAEEAVGECHE